MNEVTTRSAPNRSSMMRGSLPHHQETNSPGLARLGSPPISIQGARPAMSLAITSASSDRVRFQSGLRSRHRQSAELFHATRPFASGHPGPFARPLSSRMDRRVRNQRRRLRRAARTGGVPGCRAPGRSRSTYNVFPPSWLPRGHGIVEPPQEVGVVVLLGVHHLDEVIDRRRDLEQLDRGVIPKVAEVAEAKLRGAEDVLKIVDALGVDVEVRAADVQEPRDVLALV